MLDDGTTDLVFVVVLFLCAKWENYHLFVLES